MNSEKVIKYIKAFLITIILYFLVYNILKWRFDLYNSLLTLYSLQKEIYIWLAIYYILKLRRNKHINIRRYITDGLLEFMIVIVCILLWYSFIMSFVTWNGIVWFALSVKYEFMPYILLIISYILWSKISATETKKLNLRFTNFIKWIIILSLFWYVAIIFKPQAAKIFWYDANVYEWNIWSKPPAAYYNNLDNGAVRNQFLFERPIYFGFWLVMFWPIFFLLEIKNKKREDAIFWTGIYVLNIISTFSRGAWLAFVGQNILLIYIAHHDQIDKLFVKLKKYIILIILWAVWFMAAVWFIMFGGGRRFSTTGHIEAIKQSVKYVANAPIFGNGPATAGPASHWLKPEIVSKFQIPWQENLKWFNPENQYLQIMIQFGIIWFVARFALYIYINLIWFSLPLKWLRERLKPIDNISISLQTNKIIYMSLLWLSIWVVWLSFMGLFLGAFSEDSTNYPAMLLLWLNLAALTYGQDEYK